MAILVAMSSKSRVEVPGAISDARDSTYGEPLSIRQHPDQGIIVRLHTGVEVYLNVREIEVEPDLDAVARQQLQAAGIPPAF
jgi:hypothetical protein